MQGRKALTGRHPWRPAILAWLVCGLLAAPAQPPGAKGSPQPLPPKIVTAWQKAGAKIGWMGVGEFGFVTFVQVNPAGPSPAGLAGAVPGFRFLSWQEGVVSKLPAPAVPFGLFLGDTKVMDAGLKELAGLQNLQTLDLSRTNVSDAGLKELAALKSLQTLDLSFNKVSDAGLKEVVGLKGLQSLNLVETKVTDVGLKELARLKQLHTLFLHNTEVTDVGLKELAGLKQLHMLGLGNTKVTDAGVKEFQKALPGCKIVR